MTEGHGDDMYRYGGKIKMNFSSNIYPGANLEGLKAWLSTRLDVIASYPEPRPYTLEAMIAEHHGIPRDCVMVTAGATEAIYLTAQAFANGPRALTDYCVNRPTFSEYDDACRMFGYTDTGTFWQSAGNVVRWICNPNNPTGEAIDTGRIAEMARQGGITVVDQSYEDYTLARLFTPREALDHPDIILLHSMTKTFAVPGLRLGYITARPEIIAAIRSCSRPWAVNALAIEAGIYLLRDHTTMILDLRAYLDESQWLRYELNGVDGISVRPTATNFMLAEMERHTAAELKEYLATRHAMLIRDCSNFTGLSPRHFRIAAGQHDCNSKLVGAIKEFMT